jgi:hypothetical protein
MEDQMLIASFFLVNAFAFAAGYYIGNTERKSRNPYEPTESGVQPEKPWPRP